MSSCQYSATVTVVTAEATTERTMAARLPVAKGAIGSEPSKHLQQGVVSPGASGPASGADLLAPMTAAPSVAVSVTVAGGDSGCEVSLALAVVEI